MHQNRHALVAIVTGALLLSGCGGGGSSTGSATDPSGGGTSNSYTLGGSITGLTAAGLVLANGTSTVSPAAGAAAFTFSPALASGSSYDVTVQTQPAGETCTVSSGAGKVGSSAVTSVSVTCQPQEFVYAAGSGIYGYSVDFTTGELTALPGNPLESVTTSGNILVDPSGHFLFDIENHDISVYSINYNTGDLTAVVGNPFSAGGQADFVAIDPTGHFLYAATVNGEVYAYTIDGTTGALTAISGSPYPAGLSPKGVAVDSSGHFLYVVNSSDSTVSAYTINSASGALTPVSGSPFAAGSGAGDCFLASDPHSSFIYVYNVTSSVATISPYAINTSTGALTAASGGASYAGGSSCGTLAIDPSGLYVYATDPNNNQLWMFTANLTTGALAADTGALATTPNGSTVDPSGQYLYVAAGNYVDGFTINTATGEIPEAFSAQASAPGTYAVAVAQPK